MRSFSLLFKADSSGEARRIEFEARDPSAALELAEREGGEQEVALYEGDMLLGRIQQMGEFWRLSPA